MTTIDAQAPALAYRARGWWRDETVLDDLRRAVARHPDKPATVCYHADGRPPERLTFAELAAHVERFAAALAALGVGRGDVVSLQLPNSWRLTALCLACALLRHPAVREVAVVGYPDERLGERACALVVPDGEPPALVGLVAYLDALGMARQYWPERLEILAEPPKTPSGKIQKFLLRERLAKG